MKKGTWGGWPRGRDEGRISLNINKEGESPLEAEQGGNHTDRASLEDDLEASAVDGTVLETREETGGLERQPAPEE